MARSGPDPAAPLHLMVGAEPSILAQVMETIRKAHGIRQGDPGWEELHLEGGDTGADQLFAAVAGGSLFASNRLVLVRRAEDLSPEAQEVLASFLGAPAPGVVLVLAMQKADRRTTLFKSLKKAQTWELAPPSRPADLARWAQEQAVAEGVKLSPQSARRLVEAVDGEAVLIPGEVGKLAAYAAGGSEVSPADVDALVSTAWPVLRPYAIFDLVDAVSRGDAGTALERFRALIRRGEPPLRILAMLARQWHLMAMVEGLRSEARGGGAEQVAQAAGIRPFEARKLMELAIHWDAARLAKAVELTASADLDLKGGAPAPTTLELLVLRLSRLSGGAGRLPPLG
ncbi:DNA polymerase III subunit delta [Limnochorda pilosa]|uniref:DNA polymerase III subunit delta n=1 Tax=Limnochorda pilosa TaxID=1555112 RepID=A0A0K2SNE1_LIMPI|nr:DNA polymerase III subunit delta [Limnochorda pilosa]BAS28522.1 DNA polymerase III subunit delta [Limnochorda pilosa]